MKKYIFSAVLFIAIFKPSFALADNIQTGDATVKSSVTTKTSGSNCSTHIEVTVNGQKEVLDSTDCGTQTLNKTVNTNSQEPSLVPSITQSVFESPTVTISSIPTSTPMPAIFAKKDHVPSLISVVIKGIQDLFKHIFRIF